MKSRHSKVLQPICGRTMVEHALEAVSDFCKKPILVVGHDSEAVKAKVGDRAFYAEQKEQLGTGHAVLCARGVIDGPFAVINSDDFYGRGAFTAIGGFLTGQHADNAYAMVGYRLHNAMTEHGSVARGVCELRDGYLTGITERTHIEKRGDDAAFTEDGEHFTPLSGDTTVSMNFWGFTPRILDELAAEFPRFLQESVSVNPLKAEFYLPTVANNQLAANRATVRVLHTDESWHGVTYREDLASVQESVAAMHAAGIYPPVLFE